MLALSECQACWLSDRNYTPSFPESSACTWQILGLISLYNHMRPFFNNKTISLYASTAVFCKLRLIQCYCLELRTEGEKYTGWNTWVKVGYSATGGKLRLFRAIVSKQWCWHGLFYLGKWSRVLPNQRVKFSIYQIGRPCFPLSHQMGILGRY